MGLSLAQLRGKGGNKQAPQRQAADLNTGTTQFRFLETFKSPYFVDLSLDTWMALTPQKLLEAHLNLDQQVMDTLRKTKAPVVPA